MHAKVHCKFQRNTTNKETVITSGLTPNVNNSINEPELEAKLEMLPRAGKQAFAKSKIKTLLYLHLIS